MTTIRADAHRPEFHRAAPPQLPVRVASTANVTIATGLNAGDTIDGVTLAAGDRVLLKNQSTGAENGIYISGATPERAFDMLEGVAAYGAVIYVVAGTANGGKTFANTNTTVPTIDTTALTFADYTPGGSSAPTTADYLVGTSQAGLSAEIVVGTTPGGELGNTWASPTVDSTHSGSAHTDFIAKSVLTTQDDIIVRDASAPARLAKGSDGQVLTVNATTHHLSWETPAASISGIGVKEAGSTVVASATALDFTTAGFDVTSPGGGVAAIALDPTEVNVTAFAYPGGTTNFLRSDGTFADPGVPAGTSFNEAVYGGGSDGTVTISVDTTLTRDMYYNDLTVNTGIALDANGWRVFVKGTLTLTGTALIKHNAVQTQPTAGGNGTGAVGGAAGAAGSSANANNLGRGSQGVAGKIGGFNAAGTTGVAGQQAQMFRMDGTSIDHSNAGAGGAGANAGGGATAGTTGNNIQDFKPIAYPQCMTWSPGLVGSNTVEMNGTTGRAPGGASGSGSAAGGGGGGGGSGAGGGPVVIAAKVWTGSGNVQSLGGPGGNGGNGFASSGSNGGGGGGNGGPGGAIVQIYSNKSGWSGALVVTGGNGGTHGNGNGGGSNGTDGATGPNGITIVYRIS